MGIPDGRPSGLFDYFSQQAATKYRYIVYNPGGSVSSDVTTNGQHNMLQSTRNGKTSNRKLPIAGTSSNWMPPSSYNRNIWRVELIQPGEFRINRSWGEVYQVEMWESANSLVWHQTRSEWKDWWEGGQSTYSLSNDNTRSRLVTECLLNLKDQKVNLGENLATLKQTVDMFAKNGSTLFQSLREAKRGNWKGAFGHLGLRPTGKPIGLGLSQRYLEYIYGLQPLMGDLYGGYELINEQLKPALLVYARRVLRDEATRNYESWDASRWLKIRRECQSRRRDKIQLVGKIKSSVARDVARAGLSNPASLAWDLLPWSFAVDWALPIGSTLSALDAAQGLDFVGGYISRVVEGTEVASAYDSAYGWYCHKPFIQAAFQFSNVREKLTDWPAPQYYAKSPFSTSHMVTALALFRQLF